MGRKKIEPIAGIYMITCKANGKIYIGSSKDVMFRKRRHFSQIFIRAKRNDFAEDLMKYGKEGFDFEILCECDHLGKRQTLEMELINKHRSYDERYGYNILH